VLSRWLRYALTAEAAVFAMVGGVFFWARGANLAEAAALALIGFLAFNAAIVALVILTTYTFALKSARESPDGLKLPIVPGGRMVAKEWLATLLLFVFIQPFERWWMGADIIRRGSGRTTVVLVHGYCCNQGFWWWLRSRLRPHGLQIATLNLEPPFGSLDELTESLRARLDALSAEAASEEVVLVGHSMGGLVASAYMRRYGPGPVTKLVTLGTPHHGSRLARFGPGRNAREMEPGSDWLHQWTEADALPVPTISARSPYDNYVIPQDSSILTSARNIVLPAVGHLAMAFSSDVLRLLVHEITEAACSTSGEIGKRPKNAHRATAE